MINKWEYFEDKCSCDMDDYTVYGVRRIGNKDSNSVHTFHLFNKGDAKNLCNYLNTVDKEMELMMAMGRRRIEEIKELRDKTRSEGAEGAVFITLPRLMDDKRDKTRSEGAVFITLPRLMDDK